MWRTERMCSDSPILPLCLSLHSFPITWANGARHALVSASCLNFNVAEGARGEESDAIRWLFEKQLDINMGLTPRHGVGFQAHISRSHFMFANRCSPRRSRGMLGTACVRVEWRCCVFLLWCLLSWEKSTKSKWQTNSWAAYFVFSP